MSAGVHTRVWENAQEHGTSLLFLLALADEGNDSGDVDADVLTLAKKARTSERHIRRLVDSVDAMDGCTAVLTGGRVRASLAPFAVKREPVPMIVEAEPTPTDELSSADKMSVADEMSGQNVRGGRNVRAAQPETPPPTRDVFIPPPVPDKTKTKASSDACRPSRPPTAQQAMVGEVADVIGVDLALIDDVTRSNVCKLAAAFVALDVPPGMPTAAWAAERRRIAGFADGRAISPPTVARLRTLVGAYRKAQSEGQPADLPPGQRIDLETGRRVVVWEDWR